VTFTLVTPPKPVLSLAEVKDHLRVEQTYLGEDALIDGLIQAATAHIDGPTGWLGRCLGRQTWDMKLDSDEWPAGSTDYLQLPCRPTIAVDFVKYTDTDGVEQTWRDYTVLGLNSVTSPARIIPNWRSTWPRVRSPLGEAATVRFTAGYSKSDGESSPGYVNDVPTPIRAALKLMIGDLYMFRETVSIEHIAPRINMTTTVENLLAPFRVWEA